MRKFLVLLLALLVLVPSQAFTLSTAAQTRTTPAVTNNNLLNFQSALPLNGSAYVAGWDLDPAALVAANESMWVVWQSNRAGSYQIYYQTYDGIRWTKPTTLSTASFNSAPSIAQLQNGTVVVTWAAGTNGNDDHLYIRTFTSSAWGSITQLTSGSTYTDELPNMAVRPDGTLWLFFERDTFTGPSTPPNRQAYYKTLKGNTWSADTLFTTDTNTNKEPNPAVMKDGSLWVTWSRSSTPTGNTGIYLRTYNGTQWTSDTSLVSPGPNDSPDLVQDRNGTLWLLWSQTINLNATVTENQISYRYSTNVGQTWTATKPLTLYNDTDNPVDSLTPFAVQGADTTLYVFFATDAVPLYNFDIYYIQSFPVFPVHDVGVKNIQAPAWMYPYGYCGGVCSQEIAKINVTVANLGDYSEQVTVTLTAKNQTATNQTIYALGSLTATIQPNLSNVFKFNWNVTGSGPCAGVITRGAGACPARYAIIASVPRLNGESQGNALDNSLTYKSIPVLWAGDINHDGKVSTADLVIMGQAYGSVVGGAKWLPSGDLNRDGKISTADFVIAGQNFNKKV